jgi:hypothetical protein
VSVQTPTLSSSPSIGRSSSDVWALAWGGAAWFLLAAVFAIAIYRAATQPIAHDEALEYTWFLDGGVLNALHFNSTNHVLLTLLAKPVVKILGVTEFCLRIPTLLGTFLYVIGCHLLSKQLFGGRLLSLLSTALLSLNPTVMDFMAAARGYALGLGFLIWAMYLAASVLGDVHAGRTQWRTKCRAVSVLLALSVLANLTNLIPAVCLLALFLSSLWRRHSAGVSSFIRFTWESIAPGAIVGFSIFWPFLIQARPSQFAMGLPALSDSLRDNFNSSFLYKWTGDIYSISLGALPISKGTSLRLISDLGIVVILPLLFVFVLVGTLLLWRQTRDISRGDTAFVFAATAIFSVLLNWVLHVIIRMNYPVARTSLYLVPLFSIAAILVAREFSSRISFVGFKIAALLIAIVVITDYAASFNTKYFRYNRYDVISHQLYQTIYTDARSRGLATVRVGGTWWYQPEIDFYSRRYRAAIMAPYDIVDWSYWWNTPGALSPANYDYFVFTSSNDPHLTGPRVRTIFHNAQFDVTVEAHDKQ